MQLLCRCKRKDEGQPPRGMPHRHAILMAGMALLIASQGTLAQSAPLPSYRAPWVAVPNAEALTITVKEKDWAPALTFRPARTLVLEAPVMEPGKRELRLDAGTLLVAMDAEASIACQLERPKGRYNIGCLEDYDADGRYDGIFMLNNANPLLFSAQRQPRQQKIDAITPVTLRPATAAEVREVTMMFLFDSRSELTKTNIFQLCVMREGVDNIWGDKTHARGCLPSIQMKDGAAPLTVNLYGRTFRFSAITPGMGELQISAQPDPISVQM